MVTERNNADLAVGMLRNLLARYMAVRVQGIMVVWNIFGLSLVRSLRSLC